MEEIAQHERNQIKPVSDTLLVLNKDTNKIEMVKGVDKDGNLQKIPPDEKRDNDQLIRVDKHGDLFSNFFSNFYRQLKTLRISISSRFPNTMPSKQQKTFRTMSIRHHLMKRKS
nr:hypothetical protein [Chryseobacterium sp. 18068]